MNGILIVAASVALGMVVVGFVAHRMRKREPKDASFEDAPDEFPENPESILRRVWGNE